MLTLAPILAAAVSIGSLTEADRNALNRAESVSVHTPRSAGGQRLVQQYHYAAGPMRRSLPNVSQVGPPLEPGKVYPLHLLVTTNYRLPADVDRANLEVGDVDCVGWDVVDGMECIECRGCDVE